MSADREKYNMDGSRQDSMMNSSSLLNSSYRPYPLVGPCSSTFRPELHSSVEFQTLDVDVALPKKDEETGEGGNEEYVIDGSSEVGSSNDGDGNGNDDGGADGGDDDDAGGGSALLASKSSRRGSGDGDGDDGDGNGGGNDEEDYVYKEEKKRRDWLGTFLPASRWIRTYDIREDLFADIIAGISLGIVAVPIGMSDAALAGLPVQYGLYSSFIPMYIYALFGSSREIAVGPAALLGLVLQSGLNSVVYPNGHTDDPALASMYQTLAIQVAFLSGLAYIGMGLLRFGFIMNLLKDCVVSGFTTGAAILIATSQLANIVGYSLGHTFTLPIVLKRLFQDVSQFNIRTFLLGVSCVIVLVTIKVIGRDVRFLKNTGPLIVTTLSIFVSYIADSASRGIAIVGHVPRGLPDVTVALWTPVLGGGRTAATVLAIMVLGFMKHLTVARQLATKGKYDLNPSDELVGLGITNLCGAAFQGMPVMGSLARSAVNIESGARSNFSGIVCATFVMLAIICLAPAFEPLPTAVLSSIVIVGVMGLVDIKGGIFYWHLGLLDFFLWCVACLSTTIWGVDIGMAVSVGCSSLLSIAECTGCRKPLAIRKENEDERRKGFGKERRESVDDVMALELLFD